MELQLPPQTLVLERLERLARELAREQLARGLALGPELEQLGLGLELELGLEQEQERLVPVQGHCSHQRQGLAAEEPGRGRPLGLAVEEPGRGKPLEQAGLAIPVPAAPVGGREREPNNLR